MSSKPTLRDIAEATGVSTASVSMILNGKSLERFSSQRVASVLAEAERILRSTAANSAEWYFLMGSIAYKRGWMDDARQNFWTASSMEPNNIEYRQAVNQMNLQAQRGSYQGGDDLANLCTTLCCLNCLCNSCN